MKSKPDGRVLTLGPIDIELSIRLDICGVCTRLAAGIGGVAGVGATVTGIF